MKKVLFAGLSLCLFSGAGCESSKSDDCVKKAVVKTSAPSADPASMDEATKKLYDNWQALKKRHLRLVPAPKEIAFKGDAVKLPGKAVIVLENKTQQGEIAANEIVSRVKDLTGKEIPVKDKPQEGAYNIIIENKWPNFFSKDEAKVKTKNPYCRKQAYGLEPIENGIKLAGNSPIGMMYAAVTLRYLIGKKDGAVVLYPARVVDWPDYPRRLIACFFASYHYKFRNDPQKHFAQLKKFADWAFRLKINFIDRHTYTPYYRTQSPFNENLKLDDKIAAAAKPVSEYLVARGIGVYDGMDVSLAHPAYKDCPGVKEMFYNPVHKKWYSWARHDLHKKKAELMGNLYKGMGMTMINVHSIDGGGFRDPEYWSERDKLTRDKYGDDRARANLDMLKIYIDAFKEKGMDTRLVIYPYSGLYLQEDFGLKKLGLPDTPENRKAVRKKVEEVKAVARKLNDGLPKDIAFCVREGRKKDVFDFYDIYPGRAMSYSFYPKEFKRDIMPLLPAELNTWWSGFSPDRKTNDIARLAMERKFMEQSSVVSAEYTWNANFPGCEDLDRTRNPVNYDPAVLDIMAERAAVGLWGDEAGQNLKDLFNDQLSFYMAYAPKETTANLNLKNLLPFLKHNYMAAQKAEKSMDKVWAELKKNKSMIDAFSYPIFITYYKMLKAAVAYAAVNYYVELGDSLARKGDMAGAEKAVKSGREALKKASAEYLKTMSELKGEPELVKYSELTGWWRKVPVHADSNLLSPDFKALSKKLDDLDKNKEAVFQQYNVPAWLDKFLKRKNLTVGKVQKNIKIDGVIDEEDWNKAVPVEHFIGYKAMKMPTNPVVAKLLYDDENIYLSGEIVQPLLSKLPKGEDGKCDFSECMEFFILPDKNNMDNYFQLAVDSDGNIFSLKKEGAGVNLKKTLDWKGGAKAAAVKKADRWSFELAVPFRSLAGKPGKDWRGMICYDGVESLKPRKTLGAYASNNVEGKGFHNPDKFQNVSFVKKASTPPAGVDIVCLDPSNEGETHESGSGSMITFGVALDSKRPLYDLQLTARFLDKNRKSVGEDMVLLKKKYLPLAWKSTAPFKKQLLVYYKGIILELIASYKTSDGKKGEVKKEFIIGDKAAILSKDNAFVEGAKKNSKAISCPFFFDVNSLLSAQKGAMEFWFKPDFEVYEKTASRKYAKAIFHSGPMRPKHPISRNRDAMSIILVPRWGMINFQISNNVYEARNVNAYARDWEKGQWRRLGFVWDMATNPVKMEIYLDGKLVSGKVADKRGKKISDPMKIKSIAYPFQFGCMNSGARNAEGAFDDLRISNDPNISTLDKTSSVFFSFDDSLSGNTAGGGIKAYKGVGKL